MVHKLQDGRFVKLRHIRREDSSLLQEGMARLSPATIYSRFHSARSEFSPTELEYLVSCDGHRDVSYVALECDAEGQEFQGIGVARCMRDATDPSAGEIAIVIVDEWQSRGIGSLLLQALAIHCRRVGINFWRAKVLVDNHRAIHLISKFGKKVRQRLEGRELEIIFELTA